MSQNVPEARDFGWKKSTKTERKHAKPLPQNPAEHHTIMNDSSPKIVTETKTAQPQKNIE
jgi:hypothetical protein